MIIDHGDAISLEWSVRNVFNCERFGMGGFINSDYFEKYPFNAALIALAPIWQRSTDNSVEDFLSKWDYEFNRKDDSNEVNVSEYIEELNSLIKKLK